MWTRLVRYAGRARRQCERAGRALRIKQPPFLGNGEGKKQKPRGRVSPFPPLPKEAKKEGGRRGKNRTLTPLSRVVHFYVSLTINLGPAAAEKRFLGAERHFLRTEIGPVATGILGVFPTCTYRRRYMYISAARKSLIVSIAKDGIRTRCISPLFSTQR